MNNYIVFIRTWYKANKDYPNGLEPHPGRKKIIRRNLTREEARQICQDYNDSHDPGKFSKMAEFQQQ